MTATMGIIKARRASRQPLHGDLCHNKNVFSVLFYNIDLLRNTSKQDTDTSLKQAEASHALPLPACVKRARSCPSYWQEQRPSGRCQTSPSPVTAGTLRPLIPVPTTSSVP